MCRFLLAKSEKQFDPQQIIHEFATMSQNSKALDGDWQGDGWGASWLDQSNNWQTYKSLKPVWEDAAMYDTIQKTRLLVLHARSASFPKHKGILEFNQPYIHDNYSFVFNGLLKGVSIPYPLDGNIGAQKIWSLLKKNLHDNEPNVALQKTVDELNKFTRYIQALNLGLSDGTNIYAYCQYAKHAEYYNLHVYNSPELHIICSEALDAYDFIPISTDSIFRL